MDEYYLLCVLAVASSLKYFPSDVAVSETNLAHSSPLTLEILDRSSLLASLLIAYSIMI